MRRWFPWWRTPILDAVSMSCLAHIPSNPAYYTEDWMILLFAPRPRIFIPSHGLAMMMRQWFPWWREPTSNAWSMSRLPHWPSNPAYYIEGWLTLLFSPHPRIFRPSYSLAMMMRRWFPWWTVKNYSTLKLVEAWSRSHLSQKPWEPAYYVEDCRRKLLFPPPLRIFRPSYGLAMMMRRWFPWWTVKNYWTLKLADYSPKKQQHPSSFGGCLTPKEKCQPAHSYVTPLRNKLLCQLFWALR